jgi:hypothetical protein
MAASLLGTTGNWGIPQDEAGIIITDLSFDFSNQEKPVMDKGGEIIGGRRLWIAECGVRIVSSHQPRQVTTFSPIRNPRSAIRNQYASPRTEDLFLRHL